MANQPFDRTIAYPLERPLIDDILQGASTADFALRFFLRYFYSLFSGSGFVGTSFKVLPSGPSTSVIMSDGIGLVNDAVSVPVAINGVVGLDDRAILKPIVVEGGGISIPVPAPPGSDARIDLVEVKYARRVTDPASRDQFDESVGDFVPNLLSKTLSFCLRAADLTYNGVGALNYKTGTPAASPVAPTVSAGYVAVAQVRVASGATSYDGDVINDLRKVLWPSPATATARFRIGPSTPAGLLLASATPPGIGLYVLYATGNAFLVVATGNFSASALATSFKNLAGSPVTMVTSTALVLTAVDAPLAADLLAINLMGATKVAVGQQCRQYTVAMREQKATSPFSFDQPLSVDYDVEVQLTLA